MQFNRMDPRIVKAIGDAAQDEPLPLVVHAGDARDVEEALNAGANGIEHGSFREDIPTALFRRMKERGVSYDSTLTVVEGITALEQGNAAPIQRTLVQQASPPELLASIQAALNASGSPPFKAAFAGHAWEVRSRQAKSARGSEGRGDVGDRYGRRQSYDCARTWSPS